jgi:very-short-patch-repair endonuclease
MDATSAQSPAVESPRSSAAEAWALAGRQHGVVSRSQLRELGFSSQAIAHRLARGRLHPARWRGVYAVGRPDLTPHGVLMAAVLACGPEAALSHRTGAGLWNMRALHTLEVEVSVPGDRRRRLSGIVVHRRTGLDADDIGTHLGIPVTTPIQTLIDLAVDEPFDELEDAINAADRLELVDLETLREAVHARSRQRGAARLRRLIDRRTFTLTDSRLERMFLALVRCAGLPPPLTQQWVNGFRVDFYWPELGLVVETDGLRYHRTAQQQAVDRRRDQRHAASGVASLRFSHAQVRFEPTHVEETLIAVMRRLTTPAHGQMRKTATGRLLSPGES